MQSLPPLSRFATSILVGFFKLLYHPLAWTYDLVAWTVSLGRWNGWVLSIVPDLPGPNILEIGHGPGHLQIKLASSDRTVIGLDESRQMGTLAMKRLLRARLKYRLVRGYAQALPFPNESFHQVCATFPSEYIRDPDTLAEIYRVLHPGGWLVVVPAAWLTGASWLERMVSSVVHLAGQTPEWNERHLEPFNKAGFNTSIERRELASSQLIVITARKDQSFAASNLK